MDFSNKQILLASSIGLGLATTLAYLYFTKRKKWTKVATVSELFLYPIKSTRGISVDAVQVSPYGVGFINSKHSVDRCFMVVFENGQMLTARQEPRLVLISTKVTEETITLSAPQMPDIIVAIPKNNFKTLGCRVWGQDIDGADCGNEVADWLKKFLEADYRLVNFPRDQKPRDICKNDKEIFPQCLDIGKAVYHDCAPINVLSEASVQDLNTRLDEKVIIRNFRPTIVVKNCSSYKEDEWKNLKIGNTEMQFAKYCGRCILTTVNPQTGVKDKRGYPLKTLKTYRLSEESLRSIYKDAPLLGIHLGVVKSGQINVGDDVYAA